MAKYLIRHIIPLMCHYIYTMRQKKDQFSLSASFNTRQKLVNFFIYTVSQKKQDTKLLAITSPIITRFSKFFH